MTAEQKAEEIANKRCHEIMCFGHCNFSSPKHHRCGEWHREYNCAKDGVEFGYNKANEWHYVKDGDLPSDFGNYVVCFYGAKGSVANGKPCWEELYFDTETLRWVDKDTFEDLPYVNREGIVIAWKEIVLPKEIE